VECKKWCTASIEKVLEPMRERRESISDEDIAQLLQRGKERAKEIAAAKMEAVNKAIFEIQCEVER